MSVPKEKSGVTLVVLDIKKGKMHCVYVDTGRKEWIGLVPGVEVGTVMRNVRFAKP
jgi:hypothetical protein